MFDDFANPPKGKGKEKAGVKYTPEEFRAAARKIISAIKSQLEENEIRAFAADKVASKI